MNKAVVLLSGGQDSTTVLGKAIRDGHECYALGFNYGQRHKVELEQAQYIANVLNVPYKILKVKALGQLVDSALLTPDKDVSAKHSRLTNLPASFVPNRNALFLTLAHAYAQEIDSKIIYAGMCQTDYSGYPDCRRVFIDAMQNTLNIGYEADIEIVTPLMYLTKAQTFKLAKDVGVLDIVLHETATCYNGDNKTIHEWGFGCGECPACKLRAKGWAEYLEMQDAV